MAVKKSSYSQLYETPRNADALITWGFGVKYDLYATDLTERLHQKRARLTAKYTKDIAEVAQKSIQNILRPGGPYKIGWRGQAARDLLIGKYEEDGTTSYYLYEKPKSHLTVIRRGGKKGKTPKLEELEQWIKYRNIRPKKVSRKGWFRKNKEGKRRLHRTRTAEYQRRRMAFAIQNSIFHSGTSEDYKKRFKRKYFDYVEAYVRDRNYNVVRRRLLTASDELKAYSTDVVTEYFTTSFLDSNKKPEKKPIRTNVNYEK